MSIELRPGDRDFVSRILDARVPNCAVWVFGSRNSGQSRRHSDLDLVLVAEEPLAPGALAALSEDFSGSDFPFKVDVLEWTALSEEFRPIVRKGWRLLRPALRRGVEAGT